MTVLVVVAANVMAVDFSVKVPDAGGTDLRLILSPAAILSELGEASLKTPVPAAATDTVMLPAPAFFLDVNVVEPPLVVFVGITSVKSVIVPGDLKSD